VCTKTDYTDGSLPVEISSLYDRQSGERLRVYAGLCSGLREKANDFSAIKETL
jgi:hypothetical protein